MTNKERLELAEEAWECIRKIEVDKYYKKPFKKNQLKPQALYFYKNKLLEEIASFREKIENEDACPHCGGDV
jgi:hypothetical protein